MCVTYSSVFLWKEKTESAIWQGLSVLCDCVYCYWVLSLLRIAIFCLWKEQADSAVWHVYSAVLCDSVCIGIWC